MAKEKIESIPYIPLFKEVVMKLIEKKSGKIITMEEKKAENMDKLVVAIGPDVKFIKVGDLVETPNRAIPSFLPEFTEGGYYASISEDQIIGIHTPVKVHSSKK